MTQPSHSKPFGTKSSRMATTLAIGHTAWNAHIPQLAQRLGSTVPMSRPLSEWHQHDIAAGVAHGYAKRPEVIDSWTGNGWASLVMHVMENYGVPVFSYLFGLDPEVEQTIQLRDGEDIAGAARLAVHGATLEHIPVYPPGYNGVSSKYDSSMAPPLDMGSGLRRMMLFERYMDFVGYIDFFDDMEDEDILECLIRVTSRIPRDKVLSLIGPMLLRADRAGLSLSEVLRMWAATAASEEQVLKFVQDGLPLDYAVLLTEPVVSR